MKRVHVSLRVADLDRSVAFYNQHFGMGIHQVLVA